MKNSLKILLGIITSIIIIKLFLTQFYQNTLFINGSIITMDNKNYVKEHLKHVTLYKPQNQKDCDEVIRLILNKNKSNES